MTTKQFHLGDILSITTGRLVSPEKIGGVYKILNFMTDDNLFTHQLPRAMRECQPFLLKQHPQLGNVDASTVNGKNWRAWLAKQVAIYGKTLPVSPIPPAEHEQIDPIAEAIAMLGGDDRKVIAISPDGEVK